MATPSLDKQTESLASAIGRNIDAIAKLEKRFNSNRTWHERVVDVIGGFSGSLSFVVLHALIYGGWIAINLGWIPRVPRFDPYPFMLLSVVVSVEAIFLSTFVLIKQNRMSQRADQRDHLDLQINLLAEREMTIMLQMLQRISTRLGVRLSGEEIEELSEETSVEALAHQLRQKLPQD